MVSKKWVQNLFKEIGAWVEEGLITPAQADRLKDRYAKLPAYNRFVMSVFILGAILVGLGILLFIASNWQYLGKIFKVGLVFFFILGFDLLGYYFRFERKNDQKLGEALLFLGAISFGAGVWLIAQIFQIPYNYANGLLFWMLGIFPLAFLLRSKIILVLASLLLPIWLGVVIAETPLRIVYPFFLLLAVVIYLTYRERQRISLFISIGSVYVWLMHYLFVKCDSFGGPSAAGYSLLCTHLFIAYGCLLYGLGVFHSRTKLYAGFSATVYKLSGILAILLSNYSVTFVHHFPELSAGKVYFPPISLLSYLFYVLSGVVLVRSLLSPQSEDEKKEAEIVYAILLLQVFGMHLGAFSASVLSAFYNLLLFGSILAFLYLGYLLREELIFRLALYAFALDVLTRYFDTFWKILPRSIFFTFGGLLLIFGGIYMERKRKLIEKKMQGKTSE
ncbi:MAG: DUF2157 domain-containing protein [Candidatus Omnitrophota bacterium]